MEFSSKLAPIAVCTLFAALLGINDATAQTGSINALGTGVASAYVSGCTPAIGGDFIDAANWDLRMVEPRDCTLVRIATPIFSWPLPADRLPNSPMTLLLVRPDGYSINRSSTSPRLVLTGAQLAPGQYQWSVSYTDKNGATIKSQLRRFTIENKAGLLSLPDGTALADSVAGKAHPRALPRGASFTGIALKANSGEYQRAYAAFLTRAGKLKSSAPTVLSSDDGNAALKSGTENTNYLRSLGYAAGTARTNIETLGYAGHFTGDVSYFDAAIAHLMALASWAPTGATSEQNQDQANREVYLGLSMGLDLLQHRLSPVQRTTIVTALKSRLNQVMVKFDRLDLVPNDSHLLTATGYTTEALMYAAGTPEFPEAKAMLAKSWSTYISLMGAWSGSTDGGFANSTAYGWYMMTTRSRVMAAVRLIADLDLTPMPVAGNFGDNQIAFTAPNMILRSPFGDEAEIDRHYFDYAHDTYRLYASITGKPEHEWYWRARPANVSLDTPLQAMHYLLLGLRTPVAPVNPPALRNSWIFEDAGLVALHSQSTDPARSSVFFRSSRFGSANHSHADNNSFTFVSHGKAMLISGGYVPYFNSEHHALVGRATRFKNALTFDGSMGQVEPVSVLTAQSWPGKPRFSMEARGQLINFSDNGAWAVTTGDATLAYAGKTNNDAKFTPFLSSAIRSVGYNRDKKVVVVYDWATSDSARRWELNFHSLRAVTLSGGTVRVTNDGVSACINIYGLPGSFGFTSGFPVNPEVVKPNQFQTRYRAALPSKQLVSVTVIREDCSNVAVNVSFSGTGATVAIAGATALTFDRKTIRSQ